MRLKASSLALMFFMTFIPAIVVAQEFSADVMYTSAKKTATAANTTPHHPSRIYVSKDKIRLETENLSGIVLLVNGEEHSTIGLFPARKEYQELASGPSEYFQVADPENACPDWQKATIQKVDCEKVGEEVVHGRETVEYRNKAASEIAADTVWVDKALRFVVKWESSDTVAELRNIQEASQPAKLFVVPPDYGPVKPPRPSSRGFSSSRPR